MILTMISRNLLRNRLRTLLTTAAIAIPMSIFVLCVGAVDVIEQTLDSASAELRLATHHKVTFTNLLPDRCGREIEAADPERTRILAVCNMRWYGGRIGSNPYPIQGLAADPAAFPLVYADIGMTAEENELWFELRNGVLVDFVTAQYFGLEVGQEFTLRGSLPPYPDLRLRVIKIVDNPNYRQVALFRKDYAEEVSKSYPFPWQPGSHLILTRCAPGADLAEVAALIDRTFAGTPHETRTQEEKQFNRQFIEAIGPVQGVLLAVAGVVVVVVLLAAANTMGMVFRERTRELAALKAIGFSRGRVFALVMGEGVFLAVTAGVVGTLVPAVLLNSGLAADIINSEPVRQLYHQAANELPAEKALSAADTGLDPFLYAFSRMTIPTSSVWTALIASVVVGLLATLIPARSAMRLNTVMALRQAA